VIKNLYEIPFYGAFLTNKRYKEVPVLKQKKTTTIKKQKKLLHTLAKLDINGDITLELSEVFGH